MQFMSSLTSCFKPKTNKISPGLPRTAEETRTGVSEFWTGEQKETDLYVKSWAAGASSYEMLQVVRTEQFSRVQLCRNRGSGTYTFIKVINKKKVLEHDHVSRLESEVEALTNLHHPFVHRMINFSQDEKSLYIILEFVEKGNLSLLIKQGKLNKTEITFFSAQMVHIIDYLQSMNVIHRDLTPHNFLIGEDGYLKLTNFGSAKCLNKSTRTYTKCGSPAYMAPEVILGNGYGKEVDWWCLGVIIYEMFTGIDPFYNNDPMYMYQKIVNCQMDFPSSFDKQAKNLISLLLTNDPTKRAANIGAEARSLKKHRFFKNTDWKKLILKKLPSLNKSLSSIDLKNTETRTPSYALDDESITISPSEDPFLGW